MSTESTILDEYFASMNTPTLWKKNYSRRFFGYIFLSNPHLQQPTQSPKYLTDFQPKKMEDRSLGYQIFTGRYTLDDLESDPEFVAQRKDLWKALELMKKSLSI